MTRGRATLAALLAGLGAAAACDQSLAPSPLGAASAAPEPSASSVEVPVVSVAAPPAVPEDAAVDAPGDATSPPDADAPFTGCPPEMARVGRFCIDRWEAHLVSVGEDGTEMPHPHSTRPVPGLKARSAPDVFPQGYISRVEAAAACKLAEKRLCSLGEWQRTCRGKRGRLYPYGGTGRTGACNTGKKHLLTELFGSNGKGWKYDENFNARELLETPGYLAKTGEHTACASEDGVFDLVGNLHEWVSDSVDQAMVDRMDAEPVERRKQPWREGNGVFASGFFSTTNEHGPGCTFLTIAHEPRYHDYSIGFRCCKTAAKGDGGAPLGET